MRTPRRASALIAFLGFLFAAPEPLLAAVYILNPTPPPTANWTDTSGAVWFPLSGFPGSGAGDSAVGAATTGTTLVINSTIPNPLALLSWTCPGCVIDIQSGGQLTISGSATIGSGATLKVSGGTLTITAGSSMTFDSGSTLRHEAGLVEVLGGGQLILNGTNDIVGGDVDVFGTLTVNSTLPIPAGSTLALSGATVDGSAAISSSGQVTQSGANSSVTAVLNSPSGSLTVGSGTLTLSGGGTANGPIAIDGGATLDFPSGTYTTAAGGSVSGAGTLSITGGTLSIGAITEPAHFSMDGGVLTGDGSLSIAGSFVWSGGALTGTGGTELAGSGVATFSGATSPMYLDGRVLEIYGNAAFTATSNPLELSNDAELIVYGVFELTADGTIACDCSTFPTLIVSPTGILRKTGGTGTSLIETYANNDSQVDVLSGTLELWNDGSHTGSFNAAPGTTLVFSGWTNFFDLGSNIGGGGTIEFQFGENLIAGGYDVAGRTSIADAGVYFAVPGTTADFTFAAGLLLLDAPFTMTGDGTWSEGTIAGQSFDGRFTVAAGATLTLDAATCVPALVDAELINDGTVLYTPTLVSEHRLELDSALITNNGTWDMQADAPISEYSGFVVEIESAGCGGVRAGRARMANMSRMSGASRLTAQRPRVRSESLISTPSAIDNNGTWIKSGAGDSHIEPAFTNNGTVLAQAGNLHFVASFTQNGGTTTLGAGSIEVDTPMALNGGTLDGAGTVTGDVNNTAGTVAPGNGTPGVINVTGSYSQSGTLAIGIGGPAAGQFDQLVVDGGATLGGTLTATLLNAYAPATGTTWPVLTYASQSGAFATQNLPPLLISTVTPTAVVLEAVAPSADLGISMTGPASPNAGAPITYIVTVSNNGPNTSSGMITVTNTLPAGVTGASGSGSGWACGAPAGGTITCTTNATVNSASSLPVIQFNMTAPVDGGAVQNSATVSSAFDANAANDTTFVASNVVAQADLAITKSGPNGITSGQNIVYTTVVTNSGPSSATGVTVSDPTPAGATFVSNSGACTTPFPCSLGVLTAGQSATITTTLSTSPSFGGDITNVATVSSSTADPNNTNNSATKVTNVGLQADLQITKSGPASTMPNQNIVYTITFSNSGPSPATSVVISDPVPVGIAFVSNSGACTTPFPCSIGTLNAGQSGTITSTYTVPANYTGATIVNTASISSAVNDPNTSNNSSSATTNVSQAADLSIVKTGPPMAGVNQNITYTVTVTNSGPSAAGSVVVSDTTPAGLTFVSNSGACTTPYPCSLGVLNAGQSATITSTYNIPPGYTGGGISNTATVSSGALDTNATNDSSTATTAIVASADLSISKSGPATFSQGVNLVYTIAVTNNGLFPAVNTFVTDPTPTGLTFVSNTGACTTSFPCSLGTINAGQTVTITSTYSVPPAFTAPSVTNTASVSSSTLDPNGTNDSSSTTAMLVASAADVAITKTGPAAARLGDVIQFTIVVTNNGPATASSVVVSDPSPSGATWLSNAGACTTEFPCSLGTLTPGQSATITATYRFMASAGDVTNTATVTSSPADSNTANNTASATVSGGTLPNCPTRAPSAIAPTAGSVLATASDVTFSWTSVANAIGYFLTIIPADGRPALVINTASTRATVPLQPGAYSWTIGAAGVENCRLLTSAPASFAMCMPVTSAPLASVVGETTTGQTYAVEWPHVPGATSFEIQESLSPSFTNPTISTIAANGKSFTKNVQSPTAWWYRVRALSACDPTPGPFSIPVSVAVVPVPLPSNHDPNVSVPNGSQTPVTWQMFVPGVPDGTVSFVATADRPWLTVFPTSGIMPPEGMNFTISADPSGLVNGTWTGTILVVYGSTSVKRAISAEATTKFTVPVSISLVTPVTPTPLDTASDSAMVVPSVGHLAGIDSRWRSDIRLSNLAANAQSFQLVFNPGTGGAGTATKTTTVTVAPGATTALDDVVRSWYGVGSLGNSSNGLLTVQPVDGAGKPLTGVSNVSAVSSRTFNASESGTFGQFIPAVPFPKFIGRSGGGALASALSLQQLADNSAYRTNLGISEAAGKDVSLLVSAFDGGGAKLFELPLTLKAGEQKSLNSVFASNGVSAIDNGRLEVRVTGGDGKVTAYASVVDNLSQDPILITGTAVGGSNATRFVVPGIADFSGGGSNWRSDVRIFNDSAARQQAMLTFYPSDSGSPVALPITLNAGEIRQLDDVLRAVLGVTNMGGALHLTTSSSAPLTVTARTYDRTSKGTLGQFIPAITESEATGLGGRALQILQAEESSRYRTNIGVVEVSGKDAMAEISVHLPDSKVTPVLQVPLNAFQSRQISVLSALGLGAVYNARVSVRVIGGDGAVTAYGSVIDMNTKDPTYIPAQ